MRFGNQVINNLKKKICLTTHGCLSKLAHEQLPLLPIGDAVIPKIFGFSLAW